MFSVSYLLLAVGGVAPDYGFSSLAILVLVAGGIGFPLLVPIVIGTLAGIVIPGSGGLAGIGVGLLAGAVAVGLWMLVVWVGMDHFGLAGESITIPAIIVSTLGCSAAATTVLWLIRRR